MTSINFEQALRDPQQAFGTPEAVLEEPNMSLEQKAEILRRWQYDVAEQDVALEEGMPGGETGLMHRILQALDQVDGVDAFDQSGPSKQHGLPRRTKK